MKNSPSIIIQIGAGEWIIIAASDWLLCGFYQHLTKWSMYWDHFECSFYCVYVGVQTEQGRFEFDFEICRSNTGNSVSTVDRRSSSARDKNNCISFDTVIINDSKCSRL